MSILRSHWTPSPCGRLSRPRTTTGPPSHPGPISRPCAQPSVSSLAATHLRRGRDSSHVHSRTLRRDRHPVMPQHPRHGYAAGFHRGLPTGDITQPRSSPHRRSREGARCNPTRIRQVGVGGLVLRGFQPLVPIRMPLRLASRARTIWQFWHDSSLSRTAPPNPLTPTGQIVLQLSHACCDRRRAVSFHHRKVQERLVALDVGEPDSVGRVGAEHALHMIVEHGRAGLSRSRVGGVARTRGSRLASTASTPSAGSSASLRGGLRRRGIGIQTSGRRRGRRGAH